MLMTADSNTYEMGSGALMREMAEMLTEQGFDVRGPDCDESRQLAITNAPKGRCELDVGDSGWVTCEYFPWGGQRIIPDVVSQAVLRLLAVSADKSLGADAAAHPRATLKGAVGHEMKARGLTVDLRMSEDMVDYTIYAEVAITNPEQPGRGTVCVTDDGNIWWECHIDEITAGARGIVMAVTDMLVPPNP